MERIFIVFTGCLNREVGYRTQEPIIAFASKPAAEEFRKERAAEDEKQKAYYSSEGIYDIKWWIEEISLNDMNFKGDVKDRLEAKWTVTDADNGWKDWTCSNCKNVHNIDTHHALGYEYCDKCGCRMVNPKGGDK